jgi:hypothetical protein
LGGRVKRISRDRRDEKQACCLEHESLSLIRRVSGDISRIVFAVGDDGAAAPPMRYTPYTL